MAVDPDVLTITDDLEARLAALETCTEAATFDRTARYVATDGSDIDGLSWQTAFSTVEQAIDDLPTQGSGGTLRHTGTIEIGSGIFVEHNPLEDNADIRFIGRGAGTGPAGGTEIRGLNDDHLFAPTPAFTDVSHFTLFRNLRLDGTTMSAGDYDLLRLRGGGFDCRVENVFFRGASRHGLHIDRSAITIAVRNCQWANLDGDCIYFYLNGAIPLLQIDHSQADEIAGCFLNVEHITNAQGAIISVNGLKIESATAGDTQRVINFKPRTSPGGNPVSFDLANITAAQNQSGSTVVYEEDGEGVGAYWNIRNVNGQGYAKAFRSAKSGQTSAAEAIRLGVFGDTGPAPWYYQSPPQEIVAT